ncbi:CoA transferase subunit A [Peptoniphilus sp. KCTC 25270]|uniref:CoA transferase subunit A n=1 Tax=Peptoniphilus sp. KCTC 25270 TaxID=2897414 RepID=UPI001E43728C|nr:CoA transferase subunit A [Peptoniphilus sp. KCTC 25270]MCD1146746.1 CoA transferase subunit A [Peptoniphilus sp. KCTC 25270]
MKKVKKIEDVLELVNSGDTVMIGGFLTCGGPNKIITHLLENKDLKDLTIIANDTGFDSTPGIGQLVVKKCCKKIVASHVGTNKETGRQMSENETEVVLTPQGTLAEQIRAGGFGLGGVLTPTGVGIAEIEEGKDIVEVDGKKFLLEKPLKADVAILNAYKVDTYGNMEFKGSTRNFNMLMAYAADTVIVEADNLVEVGEIDPNHVNIPGLVVDVIIDGKELA